MSGFLRGVSARCRSLGCLSAYAERGLQSSRYLGVASFDRDVCSLKKTVPLLGSTGSRNVILVVFKLVMLADILRMGKDSQSATLWKVICRQAVCSFSISSCSFSAVKTCNNSPINSREEISLRLFTHQKCVNNISLLILAKNSSFVMDSYGSSSAWIRRNWRWYSSKKVGLLS